MSARLKVFLLALFTVAVAAGVALLADGMLP